MITDYNTFNYSINNIFENYNGDDTKLEEMLYKSLEMTINENIFTSIKGRIEDWFIKILAYIYNNAKKLKDKLLNILKSVINVISKFTKKHPKLTKILIIMVLLLVITVFTAQSAQASVNGDVSNQELINSINALIGFIEEITRDPNMNVDKQVSAETLSFLIDWKVAVKSGIDSSSNFDLSDKSQIMLKSVKTVVHHLLDDDKMNRFQELVQKGEKYISYSIRDIATNTGKYTEYLIGKK